MKFALLALLAATTEAVKLRTTHHAHHAVKVPTLAQVFHKAGQTEEGMKEFFNHVDSDGDGEVSMEELVAFINTAISPDVLPDEALPEIEAEFKKADTNGSGGIDFEEAKAAYEASQ